MHNKPIQIAGKDGCNSVNQIQFIYTHATNKVTNLIIVGESVSEKGGGEPTLGSSLLPSPHQLGKGGVGCRQGHLAEDAAVRRTSHDENGNTILVTQESTKPHPMSIHNYCTYRYTMKGLSH